MSQPWRALSQHFNAVSNFRFKPWLSSKLSLSKCYASEDIWSISWKRGDIPSSESSVLPLSLRPLRHPPVKSRPSQTHPEDENLMENARVFFEDAYGAWLMTWSWHDPDWKLCDLLPNYKGPYRLGLWAQHLENNFKELKETMTRTCQWRVSYLHLIELWCQFWWYEWRFYGYGLEQGCSLKELLRVVRSATVSFKVQRRSSHKTIRAGQFVHISYSVATVWFYSCEVILHSLYQFAFVFESTSLQSKHLRGVTAFLPPRHNNS